MRPLNNDALRFQTEKHIFQPPAALDKYGQPLDMKKIFYRTTLSGKMLSSLTREQHGMIRLKNRGVKSAPMRSLAIFDWTGRPVKSLCMSAVVERKRAAEKFTIPSPPFPLDLPPLFSLN